MEIRRCDRTVHQNNVWASTEPIPLRSGGSIPSYLAANRSQTDVIAAGRKVKRLGRRVAHHVPSKCCTARPGLDYDQLRCGREPSRGGSRDRPRPRRAQPTHCPAAGGRIASPVVRRHGAGRVVGRCRGPHRKRLDVSWGHDDGQPGAMQESQSTSAGLNRIGRATRAKALGNGEFWPIPGWIAVAFGLMRKRLPNLV
jgi:hypothetical protein